jgi:VWFA-related protein
MSSKASRSTDAPPVRAHGRPVARAWLALLVAAAAVAAVVDAQEPAPSEAPRPGLTAQITSPVGRTGMTGPVRIVARITQQADAQLSPVQFFVDGILVGEDRDGPPYAVEWTDTNPFERREIVVQVSDSRGHEARGVMVLDPLQVIERAFVSSVVVEPSVRDARGRPVNGLQASDFRVFEDDVLQTVDMADTGTVPAHYALLVDSSQSMSRRIGFVREAARQLIARIRPIDQITVIPFNRVPGTVTGPTTDRETVLAAVDAMRAEGGTAILDALKAVAGQLQSSSTRNVVVLITDGYDENSAATFEETMATIKASRLTVYTVAIGGVAGVSLRGEVVLRQIAAQTGGQALFPAREIQLPDVHEQIASDVQQRYVLTYTPTNQRLDGRFRSIRVETGNAEHEIAARSGYTAPMPPPIQPKIELTIRDLTRQYIDVTASDLAVFEDGVEQTIDGFEESLTPVSIMLLLDSSGSMRRDQDAVRAAARSFAAQLPGKDRVGVITFADKPVMTQDLSFIREFILWAIDAYQVGGGTSLYDALGSALTRLSRAEGRTAIVLLTDGRDENNPGTGPGSTLSIDDVLARLEEVDATVYAIGLGPTVDRETLERIAATSSGEAYFPADVSTLGDDYRRILENLRRRYVISYTSTNRAYDGGWRRVEVRPKREGLAVQATSGYTAPTLD